MIISNLFRKVDKSWLPFFYTFFQSDKGQEFIQYMDYHSSRSMLFPKYIDIFKPFETISVDKVKILLLGSMSPPTPKYTSYSYQNIQDKQYERASNSLVRTMFEKDICTITPENMRDRNILNLNIIPFSSSESYSSGNAKLDSYIPIEYFNQETDDSFNRRSDFSEILKAFFVSLIGFIFEKVGGLIILTNSGVNIFNKSTHKREYSVSSTPANNYNLNSYDSSYGYAVKNLMVNSSTYRLLRREDFSVAKIKDTLRTSDKIFIIDIFSFLTPTEQKLVFDPKEIKKFVQTESKFRIFSIVVNYLIRKQFKNSIPIKW